MPAKPDYSSLYSRLAGLGLVGVLAVAVIIGSASKPAAQFAIPSVGGGGPQLGREGAPRGRSEQPRRIERGEGRTREREGGGALRDIGTGIGIGVIEEIGREGLRDQRNDSDRGTKGDTGRAKKDDRTRRAGKGDPPGKKPDPPAPSLTTMFFNPLLEACPDCDQLLKYIYERQWQIAEDKQRLAGDEAKLASLQDELKGVQAEQAKADAKDKAQFLKDEVDRLNRAIKGRVDVIKGDKDLIADEEKSLASLIADFKKCILAHCPDKPGAKGKETSNIIHVNGEGKLEVNSTIKCGGHDGLVSVRTGVNTDWDSRTEMDEDGKPKHKSQTNSISISYRGTKCDDCAFVQFNWTEVLVTDESGKVTRVDRADPSTGGLKQTTTDPKKPNYIVDTGSPTNASYEAPKLENGKKYGGAYNRDGDSVTIFDHPGPGIIPGEVHTYDTVKIEWKDHFEAFLICDGQVCAKVTWNSTYVWNKGEDTNNWTGPQYSGTGISQDKPNLAQYQALIDRFSPK